MPTDLPPVLILMTDQQRADAMGCAGNRVLRTPNMDRLAREGVRFGNACTVSPVCMPARACFVSGLYPHNTGIWRNSGSLPADDETFFHHLQDIGYHVMYVGKSHFYRHDRDLREMEPYVHCRGIDTVHEVTGPLASARCLSHMTAHWDELGLWEKYQEDYARRAEAGPFKATWPSPLPEEEHLDSYVGRKAVELIESYQSQNPLCVFVGFGGPHDPWDPPESYADMYDPDECGDPLPAAELPQDMPQHARRRLESRRRGPIDSADARRIRALYYAKVSLVDDWFGRILGAFENKGWLEDALVIHWSDHGEMLCDHEHLAKSVFYEGALKVPFTVRWPGRIEGGRTCESLVEIIDAFPTLLEAVGAEPSERCMGRSLWPCLQDTSASIREAAFSEVDDTVMALTDRWKYACDAQGRGFMLFDVENDPNEQCNLVGRPGTEHLEHEMRERLLRFYLETQVRP